MIKIHLSANSKGSLCGVVSKMTTKDIESVTCKGCLAKFQENNYKNGMFYCFSCGEYYKLHDRRSLNGGKICKWCFNEYCGCEHFD